MLKQIKCNIFEEKEINFHSGLNIVLGDNNATNSIGKSSLLMIIDFIFGGNTYITNNYDVVENISHHDINFCLEFGSEKFYRSRSTNERKRVYICTEKYEKKHYIDIEEYKAFLKEKYELNKLPLSFRDIVSLYSRVWGKKNYELHKPLHIVGGEKAQNALLRVIKLFNKYEPIKALENEIKELNNKKKARNSAEKYGYMPKITKKIYKANIKQFDAVQIQIKQLENELLNATIDAENLITQEVLELKEQKSILYKFLIPLKNKLTRLSGLKHNKKAYSEQEFEKLNSFFNNINMDKLRSIENFHESLSKALDSEIDRSIKLLKSQVEEKEDKIAEIDSKLLKIIKVDKVPKILVEKIAGLKLELHRLIQENNTYEENQSLKDALDETKNSLNIIKGDILVDISQNINSEIVEINKKIYLFERRAPQIIMDTTKYDFRIIEDTGTGKAYNSLIEFDLAIFALTKLPFLIHDSFLLKNIETSAIENLIKIYKELDKQSFISLDEMQKYNKETQESIKACKVIELSNEKLLFIKDWRKY